MSLAGLAVTAVEVLAAAGAAVSLLRGAEGEEPQVRHAYRWFAVAAALICASVIVGQVTSADAAAMMLSFADLPGLLVPPVLVAGLVALVARPGEEGGDLPPRGPWRWQGRAPARLTDGYVLASALFLIGWVTVFGPEFARAGAGPATFAGELIHPLADLAFVWAVLGVAAAGGRRAVLPCLALVMTAAADSLAAGARASGGHPGTAALVASLAAAGLLALAPWGWRAWPVNVAWLGGQRGVTTAVAAVTAAAAAIMVAVQAAVTGHAPAAVVAVIVGTTVAALAGRLYGLVSKAGSWAMVWQESGRQFRQLADRTSDVVLLCDLESGIIRYASRAVGDYGYTPEALQEMPLADLIHPEDFSGGMRAVRNAVADQGNRAGRYPCRVRAADGTWRYVESTVSRYHDPGVPDQLLVTARDISAQVALRRQVTHLTFHDGLTGLPNRTYVEQRAHDVLSRTRGGRGTGQQAGEQAPVAGVVILDVDGFTTVNDAVGHHAGDLLLAQIARRLRLAVSPQDTVARWGGDEFAVLVEGAQSAEEIADVAERLARSLDSVAFGVGETEVTLTASVGVGVADGSPPGHVWRNAELAVSRAKDAGGGRVEVFGGETAEAPAAADLTAAALPAAELVDVDLAGVNGTPPPGDADGDSQAAAESPAPA
jgi:diguanylate cyclase (GGDEF)-like protein/PAS domain S-box-containing protein